MVLVLRQHEDDPVFREDDIKRVRVVRGYFVVRDELVDEELELVGYGEAGGAFFTADQIEYALPEGLKCRFSAAGLKGVDSHQKSFLEFVVKEGVL
jgi:hypothetical protein